MWHAESGIKMQTRSHDSSPGQQGFTLIEVLVTLLIFLIGVLGIALYTAGGIKSITINQGRATAVKTASLAIEPMFYHTRPDCLDTMLQTFPRTVAGDNDKDTFQMNVVSAIDGTGTSIISALGPPLTTTASGNWVSPVTVTLQVPYTGLNGATVYAYPTFTLILQNYSTACDV
jgi:prepilin-type N-terminal cleavage/methylation domain-containing protein